MTNAPSKREIFIWKTIHDELLLREVLLLEPFQHRQGSKERGAIWTQISTNLTEMGMKTSQRSVRERFEKIVKEFKQKESMEERASGIDVEYTERDRAMVDILERMSECEMTLEIKKEKENKEKESAEEMRRKAMEKFGETRRRRNEENEELATPERKRRRNYDVMELMKTSIEAKKKEKEQERELREKELNLMKNQLKQQEELIKSMVTQQQQFQQSHQVVTMSILHTLSEITKKLNN